jgi:hypothetical protein
MTSEQLASILEWLSQPGNLIIAIVGAAIALPIIVGLAEEPIKRYPWLFRYGAVVILAALGGLLSNMLYFWAFLLGALNAFTEIVGKFRDEPIKAFGTGSAIIYHVVNGVISAFALLLLIVGGTAVDTPATAIQAVLLAGFGSMLVMRSRLFSVRVGNEEVSVGPEQFIKVFQRFLEESIARNRALTRFVLVKDVMNNVDCSRVCDYTVSMLAATPSLDAQKRDLIGTQVKNICSQPMEDTMKQTQSYRLGFLLVDEMGEDFVKRLYLDPPPEYQIRPRAPVIDEPKPYEGMAARVSLPFHKKVEKPAPLMLFAYGTSMSVERLARRFDWSEDEARTVFDEQGATRPACLRGYRLVFDKRAGAGTNEGLPNLMEDPDSEVWGVVYTLPSSVQPYVDNDHPGYRKVVVTVSFGTESDAPTELAQTYVAEQTATDLKPSLRTLEHMLTGVREHGINNLAPEYVKALTAVTALPEATEQKEPVPAII